MERSDNHLLSIGLEQNFYSRLQRTRNTGFVLCICNTHMHMRAHTHTQIFLVTINFVINWDIYIIVLVIYHTNDRKKWSYQLGKRKKVWKNVLMPSISSCRISANPKRKNALWRFLSCGQREFHAEIENINKESENYKSLPRKEVTSHKLNLWISRFSKKKKKKRISTIYIQIKKKTGWLINL